MKRRCVIVTILNVCLLGVVAMNVWPWEPVYQGRKLSKWLEHSGEEADNAVRHIGTNALPYLVRWIRDGSAPHPRSVGILFNTPMGLSDEETLGMNAEHGLGVLLGDPVVERRVAVTNVLRAIAP
jgi:hypothetical protein